MVDQATLQARRAELEAEMLNAQQVTLRLQGALVIIDELLDALAREGCIPFMTMSGDKTSDTTSDNGGEQDG